jgi:hypothetical protein
MVFDFQSRWEREGLQAGLEVGRDSSGLLTGGSGQDLKIGRMKSNSHMKTGSHINRTSNQRALSDSPVRGPNDYVAQTRCSALLLLAFKLRYCALITSAKAF